MNNITQIKRGSTASWSLGPELVQWEELDVWGKDSLIHCEGTDLEMNVYTSSANYFYDADGQLEDFKRPGLWLIKKNEIDWDMADQAAFKCHVNGPSDCWLEVYSSGIPEIHGQKIYLNAGTVEMTVPYLGDWGIYMRWPEERETTATARVKMSIRVKDAYEELAPGQLGVEYTDGGQARLKVGMPGISKWNNLPYIGGEGGSQEHISAKHLEILPYNEHSYGVSLFNEEPHIEDGHGIETLTFYGVGGDEPVRLRHLAPGSQDDDAVTVGQVVEFAQGIQPDWDVEDPEAHNYIKNKPFGRVEQTVLFDGDATFSQPDVGGNCYYYFFEPLTLIDGKSYFIENYGTFPYKNGCIHIDSTPIFICPDFIEIQAGGAGGTVIHFTIIDPEPSYKTLATEYLPMAHKAEIGNINPISSHGVANIVNAFSAQLGNIEEILAQIINLQTSYIGGAEE